MKYQTLACKDWPEHYLYLDKEHRCHFIVNQKLIKELEEQDWTCGKWYECKVTENAKGEITCLCQK